MLTITNGAQTLTVTKGAYNSMYAPQGWEIASTKMSSENIDLSVVSENKGLLPTEAENTKTGDEIDAPGDVESEEPEEDIDLSEIPLSEMSVPQLKTYAKQLGLEVNTDSARQLRNQIRKTLEG